MVIQSQEKQAFLVLGAPRSGTSAISHFLSHCGIDFGDPAHFIDTEIHKHNPIFFELEWVNRINDEVIQQLGSRYKDTFLPLEEDFQSDLLNALQAEACRRFSEEWHDAPLVGIKDPRFCFTLPFWETVLAQVGYQVRLVWSLRSPAATIQSNWKLVPHWTHQRVANFWLQSILAGTWFSRGRPVVALNYDQMLSRPLEFAQSAIERLKLEVPDLAATVSHVSVSHCHNESQQRTGIELVDLTNDELLEQRLAPEKYLAYRQIARLCQRDDELIQAEATCQSQRSELAQQEALVSRLSDEVKLRDELNLEQRRQSTELIDSQARHIEKLTLELTKAHQLLEEQRRQSGQLTQSQSEHINKLTRDYQQDQLLYAEQRRQSDDLIRSQSEHIDKLNAEYVRACQAIGELEPLRSQVVEFQKLLSAQQEQSAELQGGQQRHIEKLEALYRQAESRRTELEAQLQTERENLCQQQRQLAFRTEFLLEQCQAELNRSQGVLVPGLSGLVRRVDRLFGFKRVA